MNAAGTTGAAAAPTAADAPRGLPTLSCVVPCHDEAESLQLLLPELARVLAACTRAWEVILVDDGSRDATPLVLAQWAQKPGFRALSLSRNFGKEAALTAGIDAARGEVVVLMDGDGQHPPSMVPTFVERWRAGRDMVYALRTDRDDEPRFKRIGTRWFYKLVNAGHAFEMPPGAGDFRLMDRKVVDALRQMPERNRFMKGLYAWVGFADEAVPYTPPPRLAGRTKFSRRRLLAFSVDGLTAFTTWPLRAASWLGFVLAAVAILYAFYVAIEYFVVGNSVSGWTTIVVGLMLIGGIQLISLGIVGEYLGRVFEEVKRRPLYLLRASLGGDAWGPAQAASHADAPSSDAALPSTQPPRPRAERFR